MKGYLRVFSEGAHEVQEEHLSDLPGLQASDDQDGAGECLIRHGSILIQGPADRAESPGGPHAGRDSQ